MEISSINSISAYTKIGGAEQASPLNSVSSIVQPGTSSGVSGFSDLVQGLLRQTNQAQVSAESAIQDFATGKSDNIQNVVLAMANADMSFQFFLEIRNKVIDSYNELMRMQF